MYRRDLAAMVAIYAAFLAALFTALRALVSAFL